jgi:hypothetical protein
MGNQCCTETHDDQEISGFKQNRQQAVIGNPEGSRTLMKGNPDQPDPVDCKKVDYMHPKAPVAEQTLKDLEPKINQYKLQSKSSEGDIQGPYLFSADNTTYKGQFQNGKRHGMGE